MGYFAASKNNITAQGTLTVTCSRLVCVTINTGATSAVLKLYDAGSAVAASLFATIDASTKGTLTYMVRTSSGSLTAVLSGGNADITLIND